MWHDNLPHGTTERDIAEHDLPSDAERVLEYWESLSEAERREIEETERRVAVRIMGESK